MRIEEFNALPRDEAEAALRVCADVDGWVRTLVDERPYPDVRSLVTAAEHLADDWTVDDVEKALAHHPRIGERAAGSDASAGHSAREQAGVDPADTDLAERLREGNRRYEERFGRIYLVRAKGRTGAEMLALLEARLQNDPERELVVTTQQLREIAVLRVEALFT